MQLLAQCFIDVLALSAFMIAALAGQRRRALLWLTQARDDLEARVRERTAQLSESEQWLLKAQDAANAGVWQVDLAGGNFKASDEALRLHGLPPGTPMTHQTALAAVHPDDRPHVEEALRRAWHDNVPFRVELRSIHPDGSTRWLLSQAEASSGPNGRRLIGLVQDISERKQTEERLRLLMREVDHRSKNLLTLVQAVARQTAGNDLKTFRERFEERIRALAAHQDLLLQNEWKGVELKDLIRAQLAHFQDLLGTRIIFGGPSLAITAPASQTLGMALHELATNAGKYGALSSASGRVEIAWTLGWDDKGTKWFVLSWRERDGPPVSKPVHRGFGTRLIDQVARAELDAEVVLDFDPSGLRWQLSCRADRLVAA
jgi:PAS domain S-box-containing protein